MNFKNVFDNDFGRVDAEFFNSKYIKLESILKKQKHNKINEIAFVTDGEHGSPELDENSGIIYLSGHNIKENYIDFENIRFCSEKLHLKNLRASVKRNSILMSIVGTVGKCSIVNVDVCANTDRNVATIKEINSEYNPFFVSIFLNSLYGKYQTERFSTGNVQPLLNLSQVKCIVIPKLSFNFQKKIEELFLLNDQKREVSKSTYSQAEEILLKEIGLEKEVTDLNPVEVTNYNVKSFKDSFGSTGRLDSEYYQKKYDVVIEKIKAYKNGFEPLSIACNIKDKNFSPIENEEYKYIELSNIGKTGDVTGCTVELGKDLPSRARRLINTNDVVISSIEGSLQSCGLIGKEYNNSLCSTGFYVINSEKINSETLLVLFKSPLMQSIMKQNCSGTILTGINKFEFQNILVPLIEINAQQEIAKLIEESFSLKKQSEHLLEVAKRAVEIAIEENEEVAIKYIKDQL